VTTHPKDLPNIINKINDSKYGLSASIFSNDLGRTLLLGQDIRVGNLSINKITDGNIINPFGGFRQSGIGRDRSLEALSNYSEIKTTWVSYCSV
jgi:acyl-CoA reductase-like NAD-dependent aldehyde dehydrogenase